MPEIGSRWQHRAARTGKVSTVIVAEELPRGYVRVVSADGDFSPRVWRARYFSTRNVTSDGDDMARVKEWERDRDNGGRVGVV